MFQVNRHVPVRLFCSNISRLPKERIKMIAFEWIWCVTFFWLSMCRKNGQYILEIHMFTLSLEYLLFLEKKLNYSFSRWFVTTMRGWYHNLTIIFDSDSYSTKYQAHPELISRTKLASWCSHWDSNDLLPLTTIWFELAQNCRSF